METQRCPLPQSILSLVSGYLDQQHPVEQTLQNDEHHRHSRIEYNTFLKTSIYKNIIKIIAKSPKRDPCFVEED
jgi:hypothetical protein